MCCAMAPITGIDACVAQRADHRRGNDADANQTVAGVLKQFGWESSDLGDIEAARLLEPLAMVWIVHAFKKNAWNYALTPGEA